MRTLCRRSGPPANHRSPRADTKGPTGRAGLADAALVPPAKPGRLSRTVALRLRPFCHEPVVEPPRTRRSRFLRQRRYFRDEVGPWDFARAEAGEVAGLHLAIDDREPPPLQLANEVHEGDLRRVRLG